MEFSLDDFWEVESILTTVAEIATQWHTCHKECLFDFINTFTDQNLRLDTDIYDKLLVCASDRDHKLNPERSLPDTIQPLSPILTTTLI